jgi:hypothetical protein
VWVFTHGKLEKLRSLSCLSPQETYSAYMTRGAIFIGTYVGVLIFPKPILVTLYNLVQRISVFVRYDKWA